MNSQVPNVIALSFAFALDLATTFCFYFPVILNYLQEEHNTLKWSLYCLVTLPSQPQNIQQFEYFPYIHKWGSFQEPS